MSDALTPQAREAAVDLIDKLTIHSLEDCPCERSGECSQKQIDLVLAYASEVRRRSIEGFYARVNARAEADILNGRPVTGAHHRALEAEIGTVRAERSTERATSESTGAHSAAGEPASLIQRLDEWLAEGRYYDEGCDCGECSAVRLLRKALAVLRGDRAKPPRSE